MKAAIFKEQKQITVEEYPIRNLASNEVLIKVKNCGICGTDIHIYEGIVPSARPVVLGHEYAGVVADNNNLKEISVDDKIVVDPNIYCGQCDYCREGKPHFCKNLKALGVTFDGGMAEYSIVPISQVYRIPNNVDLDIAAFTEPLSCCLRGIDHAKILPGESVLIIGGGSIGQIMLQLAKASGASNVILIEPDKEKSDLALKYGASFSIDPFDSEFETKLKDATNGRINVIIECVGKTETVDLAIKISGKGSRVVIFGLSAKNDTVNINLQQLFLKEASISFSYLNPFKFNNSIELLSSQSIHVRHLITKKIPLSGVENLFKDILNSHFIKYQVINNNREAA
jgi:L-iditol 2-dehydrogenase